MIEEVGKKIDIPALSLDEPAPKAAPAAPAAAPEKTATPAKTPEVKPLTRPEISRGEIWYNRIVYHGLNYWLNLASSIAIADYLLLNGTHGNKFLNNTIGKLTRAIGKTGMSLETAHKTSKNIIETLTLTTGGTALVAPIKVLEDNKRPVVHWLNKKLGVDQTAADGHEKTADEIYIEKEQPKQTWGHILKRRVYGVGAVVASGWVLDKAFAKNSVKLPNLPHDLGNGQSVTYKEAPSLGGKRRVEEIATDAMKKGINFVAGKSGKAGDTVIKDHGIVDRWIGLFSLDSVFTAIAAVVMKVTNGAKKADMPKEIGDEIDPPARDTIRNNKLEFTEPEKPVAKTMAEKVGKRKQHDDFVISTRVVDVPSTKKDSYEDRVKADGKEKAQAYTESLNKQETTPAGVGV